MFHIQWRLENAMPGITTLSHADRSVRHPSTITFALLAGVAVVAFGLMPVSSAFAQFDAAAQDTVEVTMAPYSIDLPETLPAGPTIFKVTNDGSGDLGFAIQGGDVDEQIETIAPGESQVLTIDLQPGEYTVFTPTSDLRERGMETTLTVEAGSQPGE